MLGLLQLHTEQPTGIADTIVRPSQVSVLRQPANCACRNILPDFTLAGQSVNLAHSKATFRPLWYLRPSRCRGQHSTTESDRTGSGRLSEARQITKRQSPDRPCHSVKALLGVHSCHQLTRYDRSTEHSKEACDGTAEAKSGQIGRA